MTNIINFIQAADVNRAGLRLLQQLLYSPELKFYSNRVKMDEQLNTNVAACIVSAIPRLDARIDDGLGDGRADGPQAGGERA